MREIFEKINSSKFFISVGSKTEFLDIIKKNLSKYKSSASPLVSFYIYIGSLFFMMVSPVFLKAFAEADVVYLDGYVVGWISKILYGRTLSVFGSDQYVPELLEYCEKEKKRVFLLGSKDKVLRKAVNKVKNDFPGLKISGQSGYFNSDEEILKKIADFDSDLLIVGMGLQKQEEWAYNNRGSLNRVSCIICVGNYIDILGGDKRLPPDIFKKLNLRWAYRLATEPNRLWKRYLGGVVALVGVVFFNLTSRKQ